MDWNATAKLTKEKLLNDPSICKENRSLFKKFFEYQEYKLKRTNKLTSLDEGANKTIVAYSSRLRVVNSWFNNKPWVKLTKQDIKKVYDDLEDGKIKSKYGKPIKDKATYYKQIIRSKPFELAGKRDLAIEIMEFYTNGAKEDVRFIKEETFRKLVELAIKPEHKALLWLCWDIGENCTSILKLRKRDCSKQQNNDTKEFEYLVNLRKEILKRSRTPRGEITNYKETAQFLDLILKDKEDNDLLFDFDPGWAKKILSRVVKLTKARCIPNNQSVTLKDLRSSMACDLLSKGWTTDEVNSRLGHRPSSKEIDKYVNFLSLDRHKPKKKLYDNQLQRVLQELEERKNNERLTSMKITAMQDEMKEIQKRLDKL